MNKVAKKLLIFSGFAVAVVLGWGQIHSLLTAAPAFAEMHEEDVILYATSWCPNCKQTRKFLKANNIPYFEYDVDNNSEGQRQFKQLHGNGVPVILIKTTVVRGYNPTAIMSAAKAHKIL